MSHLDGEWLRLVSALAILGAGITGCAARPLAPCVHDIGLVEDLAAPVDLGPPADLLLPRACRNVYVVTDVSELLVFDPPTLRLTHIGNLRCPAGGGTPETMAISRDDVAYVTYTNGLIFRVDTTNAACTPTGYKPQLNLAGLLGSAFVADAPGRASETLFVAGGYDQILASVDTMTLMATRVGPFGMEGPELTGTANGDLWGFFAGPSAMITHIDKKSAAIDYRIPIPALDNVVIPDGGVAPASFAFAFWGGTFWIFLERIGIDPSTVIYNYDPASGRLSTAVKGTGRSIVGAGVSSCAPLGLDR